MYKTTAVIYLHFSKTSAQTQCTKQYYLTIPVFSIRFQQMYALKMFVLWDTHVIQKHNSVVHVFVSPSESGHNHAFHEKQPKKKPQLHTKKISFHNFLLHKLL